MTLWCHGWCCKPMLTDCIPHPYQMYLKCLSTFICCEWVYGCNLRLLFYRCGPINLFWKIGVRLKQMMSWQRLGTPVDCIPLPYQVCMKCLSTLIWCGWAYGSSIKLWYPWRYGQRNLFLLYWGKVEPNDIAMSWLSLQNPCWLHSTSNLDVYEVLEHLHMLWMGVWVRPWTIIPMEMRATKYKHIPLFGWVFGWNLKLLYLWRYGGRT